LKGAITIGFDVFGDSVLLVCFLAVGILWQSVLVGYSLDLEARAAVVLCGWVDLLWCCWEHGGRCARARRDCWQPAACNLQNIQPATCNLQPATCNLRPSSPIPHPSSLAPQPTTCMIYSLQNLQPAEPTACNLQPSFVVPLPSPYTTTLQPHSVSEEPSRHERLHEDSEGSQRLQRGELCV
jgi:hypothetical protein